MPKKPKPVMFPVEKLKDVPVPPLDGTPMSFSVDLSTEESALTRQYLDWPKGKMSPQRLQYREEDEQGDFIGSVTIPDAQLGEPTMEETDETLVVKIPVTYTKKPRIYRRRKKVS